MNKKSGAFFDTAECYMGTYEDGTTSYNEEIAFDANRELLKFICQLAEEKQATPAQISLAWYTVCIV